MSPFVDGSCRAELGAQLGLNFSHLDGLEGSRNGAHCGPAGARYGGGLRHDGSEFEGGFTRIMRLWHVNLIDRQS